MKYLQIAVLSASLFLYSCGNKENKKETAKNGSKGTVKVLDSAIAGQKITEIDPESANVPKPATFSDKFSYLKGLEMGEQMKEVGIMPNTDYFTLGVNHALASKKDFLTNAEMTSMQKEVMKTFQDKMNNLMEKKKKEFQVIGKKAKAEGEAFLSKNKSQADVKSTPSGLQYKILKEGSGKTPIMGDVVVVHLKGTFIDGTVFDDTFGREPIPMMIDKSIMPAWREALLMMKPGDKLKLFVPSDLAFGDKGVFPRVPPNTAMIFEIQLVENKGKMQKPNS